MGALLIGGATVLADLNAGLVGWWKFDEGTGTTVGDSSGNDRNGTAIDTTWTTNQFGQPNMALRFNGTSSRVDVPGTTNLNLLGGPLTISARILIAAIKEQPVIIGKHVCGTANGYLLEVMVNRFDFGLDGLTYQCQSPQSYYADGRWHHVVGVFNGTLLSLYVDGDLVASEPGQYTKGNASIITIGGLTCNSVNCFNGIIDDVRIFNRALSATEVVQLFEFGGAVLIPGGSFVMGNSLTPSEGGSEELPPHSVHVSAFYMDRYEVTSNLWATVLAWSATNGFSYDNLGAGKDLNHPVQSINWYDAVKWCNARSMREGRTPCFYTNVGCTAIYRAGHQSPYVKWDADGYRLPTEAEWEKAARGGASGHRFPWQDAETIAHSRANYQAIENFSYDLSYPAGYHPTFRTGSGPYTSPVGYFAANGYGLYDMAGNVWEWCWDWYDYFYYTNAAVSEPNPRGPASSPSGMRCARSGAWSRNANVSRCANREFEYPWIGANSLGFRCVRSGSGVPILDHLDIIGSGTALAGGATPYTCTALFSDGSSSDVSSLCAWEPVGPVPPGTQFSGNSLIPGAVTGDYPVTVRATYSSEGETRTATKVVTIRPALRVTISQVLDEANSFLYGKELLSAQVVGATGAVTYQWNLTGADQHGSLSSAETWAAYSERTTYPVSVTVSSGGQQATGLSFVGVGARPVLNQPAAELPPDPTAGAMRQASDGSQGVVFDAAWKSRTNNGLIIITHGIQAAATNEWLTNMAVTIQQRLSGPGCPNVVLYDWQDAADPVKLRKLIKEEQPGLCSLTPVDWLSTKAISIADFTADCWPVKFNTAPPQGIQLANWIFVNIQNGNLSPTGRVQIIGHSAGGFVAGECALALRDVLTAHQVTMLDTPFPYKRHVKKYQDYGKVERYISSVFGLLTLDFQTEGGLLIDSDINVSCNLAGLLCSEGGLPGKMLCTWACNQLFPVPTSSSYHRSVVIGSGAKNLFTLFDHSFAHEWYRETVRTNGTDGFYYSPWGGGHALPAPAPSPQGKYGPEPGPPPESEEPITGFETFGNVTAYGDCYELTEAADAGMFKWLTLPVGAESLKFSYRFTSPGDGDFLSMHWGSNVVLYAGPDVELTRSKYVEAEVPIDSFGGQSNVLQFRLVSRGSTNAVLSVCNPVVVVNPDFDGDGLTNELELIIGTNPANADTDGDGLSDGDEVNVCHTNPLSWDTDGDGLSDGQEMAAGTDPNSAASVLRITNVQRTPDGSVMLEWASITNRLYRINRSLVPSRASYTTLTNAMPGVPPVNAFTDTTATNATSFYWIEVQ